MTRPSSIDRLPKELRELIGRKREEGCTIDEIQAHLQQLEASVSLSRSALGRHVKSLAEIGERMRRSRVMAEALTAQLGDQPDNQVARMNMELMHGIVFELITAQPSSEGGDGEVGDEGEAVTLDAKQVGQLARTLKDLATAEKVNADRVLKLREEFAKEAAAKVETVAKQRGISAETIQTLRHAVLGGEG